MAEFDDRQTRKLSKIGASFIKSEETQDQGIRVVFKVPHWTKWGLSESDDEEHHDPEPVEEQKDNRMSFGQMIKGRGE